MSLRMFFFPEKIPVILIKPLIVCITEQIEIFF